MASAKNYEVTNGRDALIASARGKTLSLPTNFIARGGVHESDTSTAVDQKNLAVYVTVINLICLALHVVGWQSTIAAAVWGIVCPLSAMVALIVYIVSKDHSILRSWNVVFGTLFPIVAFFSEGCVPLTTSGGRLLIAAFPTVVFLPVMGTTYRTRVLTVGGLCVVHLLLYALAAILDGAGVTCFDSSTPHLEDEMGIVFFQVVLPLLGAGYGIIRILLSVQQQHHQFEMSEAFGQTVIRACAANNLDAVEKAIQDYDKKEPPSPSMSDDAISTLLSVALEIKKMVPASIDQVATLSRRPSMSNMQRSPHTGGFLVANNLVDSNSAKSKSSNSSLEEIDGSENATTTRASFKALRRRSSRVAVLEDTDGEVPGAPVGQLGFQNKGITRGNSFMVVFSLPRLSVYASRNVASLDLTKLFLSEFIDNCNATVQKYGGRVMFNSFGNVFATFDTISDACAASLWMLELQRRDSTHHKDPLLNESKAHKAICVILHAECMYGTVGSASLATLGYSPADRVFFKILDNFPNTTVSPPGIIVASSLRGIAEENFVVTEGPHPAICLVEGAKAMQPDGSPAAPPTASIVTETDEYALPEFEDITGEIATSILNRGRESTSTEMSSSTTRDHRPSTTSNGARPGSVAGKRSKSRLPPEVMETWNRFDADKNGHLDVDEIRDVLEEMGMGMTEEDLRQFFDEVDADHSGTVSLEEFAASFFNSSLGGPNVMSGIRRAATMMAANTGVDNLPIVLNAWKKYDSDGSGALEAKELRMILADLGMEQSEEEVEWLVQKLDRNGNGSVDFDEFAALFSEDDTANKKLNAVKERIQTVSRVIMNKSSGKIYSNPDQDLRDQRNKFGDFVSNYFSFPLFLYCAYAAAASTYRIGVGPELDVPLAHIIVDIIIDLFFVAWFLAKTLLIPVEVSGQVVYKTKDIFWKRIQMYEFWNDLVVCLPLDIIFLAGAPGEIGYWRANKVLAVYHIDPLYKVFSAAINPALSRAANAMLYFFMFAHLFACSVIVLARGVGQDQMGDMVGTLRLLDDKDTLYLKSFYWAILTVAGQLKGEAIPPLEEQVVLLVISVLIGLPMYTVVLATIGNAVNVEDSYTKFLGKIDDVRGYFEYAMLPKMFEIECVAYYRHLYGTTGSLDISEDPLYDLPSELSIQVTIQIGRDMLKKVPIFADACNNFEFVHELTTKLIPRVIEPKTTMMKKGDRGTNMYFVTHGDFNIVIDGGIVVFTLKKGTFFGEIALLHNVKRTATIVSGNRYGNVLLLDKKQFDEVTTTFPESLSKVYKAAEDRINQMLEKEKEDAAAAKAKRKAEREEARRQAQENGDGTPQQEDSSDSEDEAAREKIQKQQEEDAKVKRLTSNIGRAMVANAAKGGTFATPPNSSLTSPHQHSPPKSPRTPQSSHASAFEAPPEPLGNAIGNDDMPGSPMEQTGGTGPMSPMMRGSGSGEARPGTAMTFAANAIQVQATEEGDEFGGPGVVDEDSSMSGTASRHNSPR